jgi:hypothetical protein
MATTKKILVLSPAQIETARNWFPFVGHGTTADTQIFNKLDPNKETAVSEKCAFMLLKWWNYLPGSLIDPCDTDLYSTIRNFLFN